MMQELKRVVVNTGATAGIRAARTAADPFTTESIYL
jgi:hypothetical protein